MVIPAVCLAVGTFAPLASALKRTDWSGPDLHALFALPTAGALHAAYIVLMGGDFVHGSLPTAPLFALVSPVAVVPLGRQ